MKNKKPEININVFNNNYVRIEIDNVTYNISILKSSYSNKSGNKLCLEVISNYDLTIKPTSCNGVEIYSDALERG